MFPSLALLALKVHKAPRVFLALMAKMAIQVNLAILGSQGLKVQKGPKVQKDPKVPQGLQVVAFPVGLWMGNSWAGKMTRQFGLSPLN
jgi:predicted MFS family arabinose efflux permease